MALRRFFVIVAACVAACVAVKLPQPRQEWPVEIPLKPEGFKGTIQRPAGIVYFESTKFFVATVGGQILEADIKTKEVKLLNSGGDDQPIGGLCMDSRGPTLYATARETGAVYAFNKYGKLLERYQVADESKGPIYLSGCVQTVDQLIIVDSLNKHAYYLPLADEGPLRGKPPLIDPEAALQGQRVDYEGDWEQSGVGFNAFGIEWSFVLRDIGFLMNKETGILYTFPVDKDGVSGDMKMVNIQGSVTSFPGALQILFDSTNENVMYLSMPHKNAVAVLEISRPNPSEAKFIRFLANPLLNGPVAIGEYGQHLYPVSGNFNKENGKTTYSIVMMPRHYQMITEEGEEFTTMFDDDEAKVPEDVWSPEDIEAGLRNPPQVMGTHAPPPEKEDPSGSPVPSVSAEPSPSAAPSASPATESTSPSSPSESSSTPSGPSSPSSSEVGDGGEDNAASVFSVEDDDDDGDDDDDSSCFPASATVETLDRGVLAMDQLDIGDKVHVGWDVDRRKIFSDIYLFSHRDHFVYTNFVQISTDAGNTLHLTSGHYLYVNDRLSVAGSVRVGDVLQGIGGETVRITKVGHVRKRGLFNPQTTNGDIVVNGLRTSTYTSAVEPLIATALLAPVRAAYFCGTGFSRRMSSLLATGGNGLEWYFPNGSRLYL